MAASRKHCFVIMPFSETSKTHTRKYWNNHFENRLKPIIESVDDIEAFRSQPLRQDILRQIINDLAFSPMVVADLTHNNPNVYWELGVRLSFSHGTITIAENGTEIPFDLKTKSVLRYSPEDFKGDTDFTEQFRKAILDCVSNPERPDSIVLETITGRGSVYSVIRRQELIQRVNGLIAENEVNKAVLKNIFERVYENKSLRFSSLRSKWLRTTMAMSCSALDLLLAEHYLEESPEFYEFAHTLLVLIQIVSQVLEEWATSRASEEWFLDHEFDLKSTFSQYQEKLTPVQQKLLKAR